MRYVDFILAVLYTIGQPLESEQMRAINSLFDAGASVYNAVQKISEGV